MKSILGLILLALAYFPTASADPFPCQPECTVVTFEVSQDMDNFTHNLLVDNFGQEGLLYLVDQSKLHKVIVKIALTDTEETKECEVTIENKSSGGGGIEVGGVVGKASGHGGGKGSKIIKIKGPCSEVYKLLQLAMSRD